MTILAALLATAAPSFAAVPGALDGSYGSCGVLTPPKPAADAAPAGALPVPGGGLVAVGIDRDTLVTVKLGADGQIDRAYGNAGITSARLGDFQQQSYRFTAVAAQPGDRIVAAGIGAVRTSPTAQAALARLNADGSLDSSFGSGGVVTNALPGGTRSEFTDVDVDTSGRIVAAGSRDDAFVVARFTPDGVPDPSFGSGGVAQVAFTGIKRGAAGAVRALPGGGVVAGGQADEQFALVRLLDDGAPDPSFGSGGATLDSPPASAAIDAVAPLPDGRILVGGRGDDINGREQVVGRYTADGRPDATFGRGGFALTGDTGSAFQIFPQQDGSAIVAGEGFARYTPAGTLDPGFGVGGIVRGSPTGPVVPQPDGSALGVAGRRTMMAFERYALADPALAALAQQPAVCGLRIGTRRVAQLVRRRDEGRFGGLAADLSLLEPTTVTWTMTARAGGRTYTIRAGRQRFEGAFPEQVVIPLTRRVQARLARARAVRVTLTGRDAAGRSVTAERDLRP